MSRYWLTIVSVCAVQVLVRDEQSRTRSEDAFAAMSDSEFQFITISVDTKTLFSSHQR
jgi:hypothetical protein